MRNDELKAWAIIDNQKPKQRWTYRMVNGKKSGVAIYFSKPTIPDGWKRKKKAIRVTVTPL